VTTEYVSNGVQLASDYFGLTAHHLLRQRRAGVIVPCFSRLGHFSSFNFFSWGFVSLFNSFCLYNRPPLLLHSSPCS
jgi:hypothetical protein